MTVSTEALLQALQPLLKHLPSTPKNEFSRIDSPELNPRGALVFANNEKLLDLAISGEALGVVIPEKLLPQVESKGFSGSVFTSPAVSLALAKTTQVFFPVNVEKMPFDGHRVHPSAVVSATAEVAKSVIIGPNSSIGPDCHIEDGVVIGAGVVIEANCNIGEGSHIRSKVFIGHGTEIGKNCELHPAVVIGSEGFGYAQDQNFQHHHIHHQGNVIVQDRVQIGAASTVDRGTFGNSVIGSGTIIDNHCHFGHNFTCGKNCIFVGGIIVAGSVSMGDACVVGGGSTLGGHINICSQVHIAGLSGVTKDIQKPGQYGGYPLQPLKDSLRSLSTLPHLPNMRKTLRQLSQ